MSTISTDRPSGLLLMEIIRKWERGFIGQRIEKALARERHRVSGADALGTLPLVVLERIHQHRADKWTLQAIATAPTRNRSPHRGAAGCGGHLR